MKHLLLVLTGFFAGMQMVQAQSQARITGNLQSNANFFVTDSAIGAFGTPQYDHQKFGAETWLNLNYSNWGFDMGLRFDMFNNSNLPNPNESYSAQGIGRWFVKKQIQQLDIFAGYVYDQIGSGIIFRAYEERSLAIDNALIGIRLGYQLNDNWKIRAFTGKQKFRFDNYDSVVRGGAIEGFIKPDTASSFSMVPGAGVVARTYSNETVNQIANALSTVPPSDIDGKGVQYNTYAASLYNTLNYGNFTWYVEGAYKSNDVMDNPFLRTASGNVGKLTNRTGYVGFTTISYAKKGLGITLEAKRTENFNFRNTPFEKGLRGFVNFLPPMARQNTYRLTTRYVPATQEFGEQAFQADVKYKLNKKWQVNVNFSNITDLDGQLLYREIYPEIQYKYKRKWTLTAGVQTQKYNQLVYEGKLNMVNTVTPFAEWLYKFSNKRSLRVEAQYLHTKDDFGSWVFGLAEVGIAPNWLFYVSNMHKLKHTTFTDSSGKTLKTDQLKYDGLDYPVVGVVYTHKANRILLSYVKQVEGINCAGGICRYEPTFHGVRANVTSSF